MASAKPLYYWLVGTQGSFSGGNEITGGASKVVLSASAPKGYDFTQVIGPAATLKNKVDFFKALAPVLPGLPTGIAIEHLYNVPGLGKITVSGPGGPAGAIDQAVTQTGNTVQSTQDVLVKVLKWLTTQRNWVRVLEYVGGAVMIGIAMRELAKQ